MQPTASIRSHALLIAFWLGLASTFSPARAEPVYSFGVLTQRTPQLTAEYWNPILDWVSRAAGVHLEMKMARTTPESNDAIARGEYDFVYSNTLYTPETIVQNYQIILRPRGEPIRGQIVVLEDSPLRSLAELRGHEVGFPSRAAFVGYAVPMEHLLRQGIRITPVFGGNQEGIMAQLKAGRIVAAGVNSQVMRGFAEREGVKYRVLWESQPYLNLPIAHHPRIPARDVAAVRQAFARMPEDTEGARVLATSAEVIKQKPPFGFQPATPADYRNYQEFYRHTLVKDIE